MVPNQNLRIHNAHTLGSPPPTLACPYCPRHFRSKGGRLKHIRAKHSELHEPNPSLRQSPAPSSSRASSYESRNERLPSSIPSDPTPPLTPPPPPPLQGFNADVDMGVEDLHFDQDYIPPEPYPSPSEESDENAPPAEQRIPDPRHVSCAYHPKLNGMSSIF